MDVKAFLCQDLNVTNDQQCNVFFPFLICCWQESEVQLPPPPPMEGKPWVQEPHPQHDPHGWDREGEYVCRHVCLDVYVTLLVVEIIMPGVVV